MKPPPTEPAGVGRLAVETHGLPPSTSGALARLAPRPRTLTETGLALAFVADLAVKHFLEVGKLTLGELSKRLALTGGIVETVLGFLRQEAKVEVLGNADGNGAPRYALTDRGRLAALDARTRDGYAGPAPIPVKDYTAVVKAQTFHGRPVTRPLMQTALHDLVLRERTLDQLGSALNSGRAIFVYGPAGAGKTFITKRLARLFSGDVLVPHAIAVNG
jgi:ABC-type multidrug transport system fused ATPase/permease subunit